ncbi:branched-chain amino acid ABC transporter permease [Spiribacter halobius]|uniref:Branched-chain amino acid ABC transporter permease n=1 Tax=Sediminicurvatus halobius TaxID=2182432 RepID=A0A2U2MW21_9GAMM|nr:branched-chain amino acid ABC transporter permease [Spiribacter halobius]PWG61058.1 branched-chain amino acid ABC transporter permease [Spiribacter halobius]UEX76770.1 branched-chain amino acid ABC transporter permease [Spiribacter halobius]
MQLFLEQVLNGLQFGMTLLLMASGLTLVFGIMNLINLAHGSLFMLGAFAGATVVAWSGSFLLGLLAGVVTAGLAGMAMEALVLRRLYRRDHLDQVLATFGLILLFNEAVRVIWGRRPLGLTLPDWLAGSVEILPGVGYPVFRLAVIAVGLAVMAGLWWLVMRTRLGMRIRAGASDREMIGALGVNITALYTLVFGLGACLAGLAGVMAAPFIAVQSGMGEDILILTFVVIVIGGIGSLRGAVAGALLIGLADTLGRVYLPDLLRLWLPPATADGAGAALASMTIYLLMALVLALRPRGLFGDAG